MGIRRNQQGGQDILARAGTEPGAQGEPVWQLKSTFDCWVNAHSDLVILEGELLEMAIKVGEGRCSVEDLDALGLEVDARRQMCQKMLSDALGARPGTRSRA